MSSSDTAVYLAKAAAEDGGPQLRVHYRPEERVGNGAKTKKRAPVDDSGYELCTSKNCSERAINYSGRCPAHGGLHGPVGMSRMDRFRLGFIGVEQLDDEELRAGCTRATNGALALNGRGAVMHQNQYRAMVQELYKRHDDRLRGMLDKAIDTMYSIMVNPSVEASDRIKAATWIFERIRGKPTETVQVSIDPRPFERLFDGIARGSREETRKLTQGVIEGEIVE